MEIPDWVEITTPDHRYELDLFESGDVISESIELSRAEYIGLKAHLAALRGYTVPTVEDAVAAISDKDIDTESKPSFVDDPQTLAGNIMLARAIYRYVPEAVVTTDMAFEAEMRKLAYDEDQPAPNARCKTAR